MDLGYYRHSLFERFQHHGAFFVSRLKRGANPKIIRVFDTVRGRAIKLEGQRLQDVLPRLKRERLDAEVEVELTRPGTRGSRSKAKLRLRLSALRNAETGEFHLYLTNLPEDRFTVEDVSRLHRQSWQVALLFRELKQRYRLSDFPSAKAAVVKVLLYAALITMTFSRTLWMELQRRYRGTMLLSPPERWGALMDLVAPELLRLLLRDRHRGRPLHSLLKMLLHESPTPSLKAYGGILRRAEMGLPL